MLRGVLAGERRWHVEQGDALAVLRGLPGGVAQVAVTSPPYWGLRSYVPDGDPLKPLELGLERTPEEYVARLVEILREVRRVLRDDGVLWLNLGDCYATGAGKVGDCPGGGEQGARWKGETTRHRDAKRRPHGQPATNGRGEPQAERTRATRDGSHAGKHTAIAAMGPMTQPNRLPIPGLKPKDLVGIPWRVAFALQADGWYLRMDNIWSKPNQMPESVEDRPTKAHEYLFLLSKSERYFYDRHAIAEPSTETAAGNSERKFRGDYGGAPDDVSRSHRGFSVPWAGTTRNRRSVWTIATQPFPEAHFATFPPALVEPCILAGTSEAGCCSSCGAPWARVVDRRRTVDGEPVAVLGAWRANGADGQESPSGAQGIGHGRIGTSTTTLGFHQTCKCSGGTNLPCLVVDPFNGAGTTGVVAVGLGRRYLGIELSPKYIEMSARRIEGPLFARSAHCGPRAKGPDEQRDLFEVAR